MKKLLFLLLLGGAVLAGVAFWVRHRRSDPGREAFTTAPVEYGRLTETVSATAAVQPAQVYPVGAEAQGKVVEVLADFNQEVEEGAVLLRLDDRAARRKRDQAAAAVEAARAAVRQAEALRDAARKALDREKELPSGVRRDSQVPILEAQLRAAEAAAGAAQAKARLAQHDLDLAELGLRFTVVRAPVLADGTPSPGKGSPGVGALRAAGGEAAVTGGGRPKFLVLDRKASLNQMVGTTNAGHLFTLAGDLSVVDVEAQVAEGDVGKVKPGLDAEFTVSSYGDFRFRAKVMEVRLLPVSERGAIFYKVVLEARNQRDPATGRWRLTPGLTANVDITCRRHERAWKVPAMALSFEPEDAQLGAAAQEKLKRWQSVKDADHWKPVWVVGDDGAPWPVFVRVGGTDRSGQTGIRDLSFTEVLEWDPELSPRPDPGKRSTYPQVIIAAPPPKQGLFNTPNIKL